MQKKESYKSASNALVMVTLAGLSLLPLSFLLSYEDNLHCTQYTSFKIALFDMKPHVEEMMPELLIYKEPLAIPLRIYFGLGLLTFYFSPVVSGMLFIYNKLPAKNYFRSFLYLAGFHACNVILSIFLAGERFSALYSVAILYGSILYPMYIVATLGWHKKLQGAANHEG